MVNLSVIPSAWNIAVVTPIYKSGDKTNLSNYRPISILPIISKEAKKWVAKLSINHLNNGFTSLHPNAIWFSQ